MVEAGLAEGVAILADVLCAPANYDVDVERNIVQLSQAGMRIRIACSGLPVAITSAKNRCPLAGVSVATSLVYRMRYTKAVAVKGKTVSAVEAAPAPAKEKAGKRVTAIFFRTEAGGEPAREWLKSLLSREDRKRIGEDIKTVEFGWPIGMPVCRPLSDGIFETRTHLVQNRIARVLFYIDTTGRMVLLHGFIKKKQRTPLDDLELARKNKSKHERGLTP